MHHDPIERLNAHHQDDLVAVARALGGQSDAITARADRITNDGIDLIIETTHGVVSTRVAFAAPIARNQPAEIRHAFHDLVRLARDA